MDINKFKNLKKEEMITEYEKLLEKYEELENDYDAEIESNDELYSENDDLKNELEEINKEIKFSDALQEKSIKDIKFGTELQNSIINTVLKYAESEGFRFEALDLPISADGVSSNLKNKLGLTNAIGELIIKYFED